MPLRDHFRPPVSKRSSWEGFFGGWPAMIVQQLAAKLPDNFVAEPRVVLGDYYEIHPEENGHEASSDSVRITKQYAYEVLIFDLERDRQLLAAIEFVSPANKDRPDNRRHFVSKCYDFLKNDVCLTIIDLVTIRQFNLYVELLALLKLSDPAYSRTPSPLYAATGRTRHIEQKNKLEIWSSPLTLGQPLPSLPIWLSETIFLTIDLESSYEETCRILRIP